MNETSLPAPAIGGEWAHYNLNRYIVAFHTNVGSGWPDHPPTVVYRNKTTGALFSRPVADWYRSMIPVNNPADKYIPAGLTRVGDVRSKRVKDVFVDDKLVLRVQGFNDLEGWVDKYDLVSGGPVLERIYGQVRVEWSL